MDRVGLPLQSNLLLLIAALMVASPQARAGSTPLVSGNGFGFAVYSPTANELTGFYAHPYKFEKPIPFEPLAEGVETTNFIKSAVWHKAAIEKPKSKTFEPVAEVIDKPRAKYNNDSHIIQVDNDLGMRTYFMPFGLDTNVLVTTCQPNRADSGVLDIAWRHPVESMDRRVIGNHEVYVVKFAKVREQIALLSLAASKPGSVDTTISGSANKSDLTQCTGAKAWALLALGDPAQLQPDLDEITQWESQKTPDSLAIRELTDLEHWRVTPPKHFASDNERRLWRQSEIVLRMAQCREPDRPDRHNHGLILASLPDGAWFVPWVRDMAYATDALIRMGHQQEARYALEAYLNARPVGLMQKDVRNSAYQVSVVRYFGNGAEEPFFTGEGATNIEFDNWGLVLWCLTEYIQKYGGEHFAKAPTYCGSVYNNAKEYIVQPLLNNLEPYKDGLIVAADTSIWEERQKDKKHFAYSTGSAINGLERFAFLAQELGDKEFSKNLREKCALLRRGFEQAFVSIGRLRGTLEGGVKNDVDGAALAVIGFDIIDDLKVIRNTVDAMSALRMPSGGYRRVYSIVEDPAIYEYWYERQEFLFTDFGLASAYLRLGDQTSADKLITPIVEKAAQDNFAIPEMYVSEKNYRFTGEVGDPTGAIPMVGYGAGAFISYVLQRESRRSQFWPQTLYDSPPPHYQVSQKVPLYIPR